MECRNYVTYTYPSLTKGCGYNDLVSAQLTELNNPSRYELLTWLKIKIINDMNTDSRCYKDYKTTKSVTIKKNILKPLQNFLRFSTLSITTLRRGNNVCKKELYSFHTKKRIGNTLMII